MTDVKIHLAFPDAVLKYDCPTCDQRCCKAGGLPLFPREQAALIRLHPALELVAPSDTSSIQIFATPQSGCWFLEDTECSLVDPHDGKFRPAACSLFPFNLFGIVQNTLVVAPNALCPLKVDAYNGTTHEEILEGLDALGAAGDPPVTLRPEAPPNLLVFERVVREAATTCLRDGSPLPYLAFQQLATQAFLSGGVEGLEELDLSWLDPALDDIIARAELFASVLGIPVPDTQSFAKISPLLVAFMPSIRLFTFEETPLQLLPRVLTGLSLYVAHWQSLRPDRALVPQTIMQMIGSIGDTLELLTVWDEPWRGKPVPDAGVVPGVVPSNSARLAEGPIERHMQLRQLARAYRGESP